MRKYPFLAKAIGESITSLEIQYAVQVKGFDSNHTFLYIRDLEQPGKHLPGTWMDAGDLSSWLEEKIGKDHPVKVYTPVQWSLEEDGEILRLGGLEDFSSQVLKDLTTAIGEQEQIDLSKTGPEIEERERKSIYEEIFIYAKTEAFIKREELQTQLLEYLDTNTEKPLILSGVTGSGKSSLLAWLTRRQETKGDFTLLTHFVGASQDSGDFEQFLSRACKDLLAIRKEEGQVEIPKKLGGLIKLFKQLLSGPYSGPKILLIIDGLHQFDKFPFIQELGWLPEHFSGKIRMIMSVTTSLKREQRILTRAKTLGIEPLDTPELLPEEISVFLDKKALYWSKELDANTKAIFLTNPLFRNPLYSFIALEELKIFGDYDQLEGRIRAFPVPESEQYDIDLYIGSLFQQVIERVAADFGETLVREILSLISCSRNGVNERNLKKLVEELPESEDLHVVLRQIRPYLINRGDLVDFFHPSFRLAVEEKYLSGPEYKKRQHQRLAGVLTGLLDEKAWQMGQAGEWESLARQLSSIYEFGFNWVRDREEVKYLWRQIERHTDIRIPEAFATSINMSFKELIEFVNRDNMFPINLEFLVVFLADLGYTEEALKVQELLLAFFEKTGHSTDAQAGGNGLNEYVFQFIHYAKTYLLKNDLESAQKMIVRAEEIVKDPLLLVRVFHTKAEIEEKGGRLAEALIFIDQAEKLARKKGFDKETLICMRSRSNILQKESRDQKALKIEQEIEALARSTDLNALGVSYFSQAGIFYKLGQAEEAIRLYHKAADIWRDQDDRQQLSTCLNKLALVYIREGKFSEALQALFEEEYLLKGNPEEMRLETCFMNQGKIHLERKAYGEALKKFKAAEKICKRHNVQLELLECLTLQADVMHGQGKNQEALRLSQEVEKLYQHLWDEQGIQNALGSQASALFGMGNKALALKLRKEQEAICRKGDWNLFLAESLLNQGIILSSMGKIAAADKALEEANHVAVAGNLPRRYIDIIQEQQVKVKLRIGHSPYRSSVTRE